MAAFINKTTLVATRFGHTPDINTDENIVYYKADISDYDIAVAIPQKYRKLSGDSTAVEEMSQAEKDSVDSSALADELVGIKASLNDDIDARTSELKLEGSDYTGFGSTTTPNAVLINIAAENEGKALKESINAAADRDAARGIKDNRTTASLQTIVDTKVAEQP